MATSKDSPAQTISKSDFEAFVPVNGFLVVRRDGQDLRAGKIHLVGKREDDRRKEVTPGAVVRLGDPDFSKNGSPIPFEVAPGDRVLIDRWAGFDVEVAETGERFVVLTEADLHGVITEAA